MAQVTFDTVELENFVKRLGKAAQGDFKRALNKFLEGLGMEFLRILQDEIVRRNVLDYRLLLHSFQKGDGENVWTLDENGLTLEVGTNVEYAKFVNDGHWTNPKGIERRFVPGHWEKANGKDRFIYTPGEKTGMVLKMKWVEGSHYWESSIRILEKLYPELLEKKLQSWLDEYFKELPLGDGDVPFDKYLDALEDIGYSGFLTVERECGADPYADIKRAVDYLKSNINA